MKRIFQAAFVAAAVLVSTANPCLAQGYAPGGVGYMMVPAPMQSMFGVAPASAMGAGGGGGCADGSCTSGGCAADCCEPMGWTHCNYVYGGFTYLRARDAEVTYASIANSQGNNNTPFIERDGLLGIVDPDYQPGFFVGFGKVIDECSTFGVQYSMYEATTNSVIGANAPRIVASFLVHPSTVANATFGTQASATLDVNYDILDFDYRSLIAYDCDYKLNYLVGARLAQLEQKLHHEFTFNGTGTVDTDVDFYGAGVRLGLEGERYIRSGLMVYGKTYLSLLAGEVRADYDQLGFGGTIPVSTAWRAGRMVNILDLELGIGWRNACDSIRASVGYVFSGWNNVVQTDEWIHGVKSNNFIDMTDKMTFDGLVGRVEFRW